VPTCELKQVFTQVGLDGRDAGALESGVERDLLAHHRLRLDREASTRATTDFDDVRVGLLGKR
jgi:hypothetical protein